MLGDALAGVLVVLALAAFFFADEDQLELMVLILIPAVVSLFVGRAGAYMIHGFGKARGPAAGPSRGRRKNR